MYEEQTELIIEKITDELEHFILTMLLSSLKNINEYRICPEVEQPVNTVNPASQDTFPF